MNDIYRGKSEEDFDRARSRALLSRLVHFLNPERENLMSLREIKSVLKPKGETYRGMQVVQVDAILGSEGRYRDFNRWFLPRHEYLRSRWVKINTAHYADVILPPIQLYEIGGAYFVRDGNHRVSVAKLQGIQAIDAEVISLNTELRIEPGTTPGELKKRVIGYERGLFEERTGFGTTCGAPPPEFSEPGRYDVLLNHIAVHKYYLNQGKPEEIPFAEALKSWYGTVYLPVVGILREERVLSRFPGRTEADVYVWTVRHWDELKAKYGLNYPLEEAVRDFSRKYGKDPLSRLRELLSTLFGGKRNEVR